MKTAVIGCGGIGSWLMAVLDRVKSQLPRELEIDVFDNDVVERKNLRHQLFSEAEIGLPKALLVGLRAGYQGFFRKFMDSDLSGYEYFVLCVDNASTRGMVYEHAIAANKRFIDLRADGRIYAVFTHKCPKAKLLASLGPDPKSEASFSCQRELDVVAGQVNLGNMAVAPVGVQLLLDDLRGAAIPEMMMVNINSKGGI